jgi:ubiquinone/menaquinone biosynthesis C-methylase UbiE
VTPIQKGVTSFNFTYPLFSVYQFWSKNRNIHFGYYRWGMNPFRLEGMLEAMNDFVASQLGLQGDTGGWILDIGCGYGTTVRQLLRNHPNLHLVGVGMDEGQIKAASASCRASFFVADFESIPLPAESFDAAFGLESFCFAKGQSKEGVVKEAARLLLPGAPLVVVDGFLKKGHEMPMPVRFLYKKAIKAWGMEGLPVLGDFLQTLEKQGFDSIKVQYLAWRMAPSLLHVPRVCSCLLFAYLRSKDASLLGYCKALLLTFLLTPFNRYFGYYAVTCRKSAVRWKN